MKKQKMEEEKEAEKLIWTMKNDEEILGKVHESKLKK